MLNNSFNFLFILFFLVLVYTKPKVAVLVFMGLVLLFPPQIMQFGFALDESGKYISNLVVLTFAFAGFYYFKVKGSGASLTLLDKTMLAYLAAVAVSTVMVSRETISLSFAAMFVRRFAVLPMFYFVGKFYAASTWKEEPSHGVLSLWKLLIFVGAYISVFGLIEYLSTYNLFADVTKLWVEAIGTQSIQEGLTNEERYLITGFYRYSGVYLESTETPMMLLVVFCTLMMKNIPSQLGLKKQKIVVIVLVAGMIVLSSTRAVILAMAFLSLVIPLFIFPYLRKYYAIGCIVIVLAFSLVNTETVRNISESSYFESRIGDERSYLTRILAWDQALGIFLDNPMLGVGIGTPLDVIESEKSDPYTTHNFYLDKLVLTGGIGTLLFLSIVVVSFRNANHVSKRHPQAIMQEFGLAYKLITIGLAIVYLVNIEKNSSGSIFWFMTGFLDFTRAKM